VLSLALPQFHVWFTYAYFAWSGVEILKLVFARKLPKALEDFARIWRAHVVPVNAV